MHVKERKIKIEIELKKIEPSSSSPGSWCLRRRESARRRLNRKPWLKRWIRFQTIKDSQKP